MNNTSEIEEVADYCIQRHHNADYAYCGEKVLRNEIIKAIQQQVDKATKELKVEIKDLEDQEDRLREIYGVLDQDSERELCCCNYDTKADICFVHYRYLEKFIDRARKPLIEGLKEITYRSRFKVHPGQLAYDLGFFTPEELKRLEEAITQSNQTYGEIKCEE